MKRYAIVILVVLLASHLAVPAAAEIDEAVKEAITRAALDYMDGAHDGDAARMERAVHPELTKVAIRDLPTGRQVVHKAGSSRLIEIIRANGAPLPEDQRNIEYEICAVREGLAAVKITSSMFYDYLLLAEIDGQWKIINVLWQTNPEWLKKNRPEALEGKEPRDEAADLKAIEAAGLNYLEGYFSGDAERMEMGVHPELTKVWPRTHKDTGKPFLDKVGAGFLVEATKMGSGKIDEDNRNIRIKVLDYGGDIALVEALSAIFYDYLQVARVNGEWRIINVLWTLNPDRPKR